jgi:uncharacterized membrane protein
MVLAPLSREAGGALTRVLEPWAHMYADSKLVATVVTFGHVASLLMAGGLAVATDRATLRALRLAATERGRHLDELAGVHRLVVTGLALSVITGLLLFASDVETFIESWVFWGKMGLVLVLLINGYAMTRAERAVRGDEAGSSPSWAHLRRTALLSMGLWYVITLAGVALVNIA